MKLTKETLKQIIKEEMNSLLNEMGEGEVDEAKAKEIAEDTRNMGDMQFMGPQERINFIVNMYSGVSEATAKAAVKMMPY
jgi:hypothetical protein